MNERGPNFKHGLSGTKTYLAWHGIKQRCTNPSRWHSPRRYITSRWLTFSNFLHDMGECPDGYVLRLLRNADTYTKANVAWRPRHEQTCGYQRTDPVMWPENQQQVED